jgi:hypothetical protein
MEILEPLCKSEAVGFESILRGTEGDGEATLALACTGVKERSFEFCFDRLPLAILSPWRLTHGNQMKLNSFLAQLCIERDQLDKVIQAIQTMQSQGPGKSRGRKSMGEAERKAVCSRMRKYWASRRTTHQA